MFNFQRCIQFSEPLFLFVWFFYRAIFIGSNVNDLKGIWPSTSLDESTASLYQGHSEITYVGEGKGVYNKEVISRGGWRIRPCVRLDFILKMRNLFV